MNDTAPPSPDPTTANPELPIAAADGGAESAADAAEIAAIEAAQDRRGEAFFWIGIALVLAIILGIAAEFSLAARNTSPAGIEAGFPLDDAWIHQVYARSFAERGAFEYNPGEPEAGLSSPLFGALLATLHLGEPPMLEELVARTRALGVGCWFALALAAALLARAVPTPMPRLAGFTAALLVAFEPRFGFAAGSGMEPLLFAALLLLSAQRALRGAWWSAGIASGLAILARPEGAVFVPILALAAFVASPAERRGRALFATIVPAVTAASVWTLSCFDATGRPLPNTFYAKSEFVAFGDAVTAFVAILRELVVESPYYRVPTTYVLLAMAVVGAVARGKARVTLMLIGAPIALASALALSRSLPLASAFYWSRYFLPIGGFTCVLLGIGIAAAIAAVFDILRRRIAAAEEGNQVPAPISALLLGVLAILPFGAVAESLRVEIESFGKQVSDVDRTNVAAARWLAEDESLPSDARIGAQDAGAVRFFGNRPVVDLLGLNDHRLIAAQLESGGDGVARYLAGCELRAFFLLDPDPGAVEFAMLARNLGLAPMQRFEAPDYSLFGAPYPKGVVLYLPGVSPR